MNSERPNPDDLLARVKSEEAKQRRGKLRIFFGYVAGVGKTYAMLQAAQRQKAAGMDVVVGYVEPHGRQETETLLAGLEAIPFKAVEYRGITLREFDLDVALARHPRLILVDELAHTNAEGLRHTKRWQDVDELLEAGIDVYSTLNVQHLESLNDVVAQITGVIVRETLPDAVLERADEIELIDITPAQLIERLENGKIYATGQARRAMQSFFQRANLVALRELSLRRSADRIHADVQSVRAERAERLTWQTSETLLVCVSPSPHSAKLIRSTKRMAVSLQAAWIVASVDTPRSANMTPLTRHRLVEHLHMADQLGAETVVLSGDDAATEVVRYARSRNVTKIIVGKTDEPRWRTLLWGSFLDDLLRKSGEIDVYVIRGIGDPSAAVAQPDPGQWRWRPYFWTLVIVSICGCLAGLMGLIQFGEAKPEANQVAAFLLGVVLAASRFGRGPGIFASIVSVLAFDFFFVPPYLTFAVSDAQYLFTFAAMLVIALTTSALTARIREQGAAAAERERRTESLYRLTRQLAGAAGSDFLLAMAGKQVQEIFGGEVVFYLPDGEGRLQLRVGQATSIAKNPNSLGVAEWVYSHDQVAGAGTDTLPQASAMFTPLTSSQTVIGVLAIRPPDLDRFRSPDLRRMMETCASQIALALERDRLTLEASQILMQAETEKLRSSLLSGVSHDLRTPLASIAGASSSLLEPARQDDPAVRRELLLTIFDESHRLSRLVDNLLQMTRIESGDIRVQKQWEVLEEIVGSALRRLERLLVKQQIQIDVPADLPLIPMDGLLIEQVLINLLENAIKYSPENVTIQIRARVENAVCRVDLQDNGPGLRPGEEKKIFEKFYRGEGARTRQGAGLGLAICQAIVHAHRGAIWAESRPAGGAKFSFTLPIEGTPPTLWAGSDTLAPAVPSSDSAKKL